MIRRTGNSVRCAVWLAALFLVTAGGDGRLRAAQAAPLTLRAALESTEYERAAALVGAPPLDEGLTSSGVGAGDGMFVAAYYLWRELEGNLLGPLHVSAFDASSRRWIHAGRFAESGSVLRVRVSRPYVFVDLHVSPSRGTALVLRASDLARVTALDGFQPLRVGTDIVYRASLRHFAPTHQERVMVYRPTTRAGLELFPGARLSAIALAYRRQVVRTYAALPQTVKNEFESTTYGRVEDFDRSVLALTASNDATRLAFAVIYSPARLERVEPAAAVARCRRAPVGEWTCDEVTLAAAAATVGMSAPALSDGRYDPKQIEHLVRRFIERP